MKLKPQYFVLFLIFFVGGIFGVLVLNNATMQDLFSRSIDTDVATVSEEVGTDPRPAVESLDGRPQETPIDIDALIQELEKELLETQNDPDKAIELRRRIQVLKTQKEASTPEADNS